MVPPKSLPLGYPSSMLGYGVLSLSYISKAVQTQEYEIFAVSMLFQTVVSTTQTHWADHISFF